MILVHKAPFPIKALDAKGGYERPDPIISTDNHSPRLPPRHLFPRHPGEGSQMFSLQAVPADPRRAPG